MDKINIVKVAGMDGVEVEHAIIDHGNEQFTSMPKSEYDRRQAEQSTPMIPGDE
jgi:hypothetical protein